MWELVGSHSGPSTDSKGYQLLEGKEEDNGLPQLAIQHNPRRSRKYLFMVYTTLVLSLTANLCILIFYCKNHQKIKPEQTMFGNDLSSKSLMGSSERVVAAHLKWNVSTAFVYNGLYDSPNDTLTNEAWDAINFDAGSIALTDDLVTSLGLPVAQRFPWDDKKGLYFLNAHHGVHCLKALRQCMHELRDQVPMTIPFGHLMHCFETLLEDVMCFADDTPRYTALDHPGKSGLGQKRQCRDWDQLERFANDHTSCWRVINPNDDIDTLLRYRYCPDDSPYNEWIHAIFGDFDKGEGASATT